MKLLRKRNKSNNIKMTTNKTLTHYELTFSINDGTSFERGSLKKDSLEDWLKGKGFTKISKKNIWEGNIAQKPAQFIKILNGVIIEYWDGRGTVTIEYIDSKGKPVTKKI